MINFTCAFHGKVRLLIIIDTEKKYWEHKYCEVCVQPLLKKVINSKKLKEIKFLERGEWVELNQI